MKLRDAFPSVGLFIVLFLAGGCELNIDNAYDAAYPNGGNSGSGGDAIPTADADGGGGGSGGDASSGSKPLHRVDCESKDEPEKWQCTEEWAEYEDPELRERGEYLVNHVAFCKDCHTPRNPDITKWFSGPYKEEELMAGREPLWDVVPVDETLGDVNSRNLTPHPTGIGDWSPEEVREAFTKGLRLHQEDYKVILPWMPYYSFDEMRDRDKDAVLAYLHSLEPVNKEIARNQTLPGPWRIFDEGLTPVDTDDDGKKNGVFESYSIDEMPPIEDLVVDDPKYDDATVGKYLVTIAGCMSCHDKLEPPPTDDKQKLFGDYVLHKSEQHLLGNRVFSAEQMGLDESQGWPSKVYSGNLTPHETGIAKYDTVESLVAAIKNSRDSKNRRLCPPMPAGANSPFGGLTDTDARSIAIYLRNIPPKKNKVPDCTPPGE